MILFFILYNQIVLFRVRLIVLQILKNLRIAFLAMKLRFALHFYVAVVDIDAVVVVVATVCFMLVSWVSAPIQGVNHCIKIQSIFRS